MNMRVNVDLRCSSLAKRSHLAGSLKIKLEIVLFIFEFSSSFSTPKGKPEGGWKRKEVRTEQTRPSHSGLLLPRRLVQSSSSSPSPRPPLLSTQLPPRLPFDDPTVLGPCQCAGSRRRSQFLISSAPFQSRDSFPSPLGSVFLEILAAACGRKEEETESSHPA